jgi:hypothetical protein
MASRYQAVLRWTCRAYALPHEQPELLAALLTDWLARVERHA